MSLCFDIGTANIAAINAGIRRGFLPALAVGIGSSIGDLVYVSLSTTAVVTLFHLPAVRLVVWTLGNLFLLYLIVRMAFSLRRRSSAEAVSAARPVETAEVSDQRPATPGRRATDGDHQERQPAARERGIIGYLASGILLALSSPTAILWFASIGSSFIASHSVGAAPPLLIAFFAGFFSAGIIWGFALAVTVATTRRYVGRRLLLIINLLSVAILAGLAALSIARGIHAGIWSGLPFVR